MFSEAKAPDPGIARGVMDNGAMNAGVLRSRWGFTEREAANILKDMEKYSLSGRRVEEVINHVMQRQQDGGRIRNPVGYIRALLAEPELVLKGDMDIREIGGAENNRHTPSVPLQARAAGILPDNGEQRTVRPKSRNAFNNFEQNIYDFDTLEKELLGEN